MVSLGVEAPPERGAWTMGSCILSSCVGGRLLMGNDEEPQSTLEEQLGCRRTGIRGGAAAGGRISARLDSLNDRMTGPEGDHAWRNQCLTRYQLGRIVPSSRY